MSLSASFFPSGKTGWDRRGRRRRRGRLLSSDRWGRLAWTSRQIVRPRGTDFAQDVDQTSLTARAPNTPTSGIYKASWRSWSLTRILRERVWKHYPFMEKNQSWLKEMEDWRPDLIFFCAGDSLFAYDVVEDLHERLDCKLIMYVTDDYILPYRSLSPFYVLRRGQIRERMLSCGRAADAVFTIGQKMRDTYEREYGLTSRCLVNMSPDHQTPYKVAHQSGSARCV